VSSVYYFPHDNKHEGPAAVDHGRGCGAYYWDNNANSGRVQESHAQKVQAHKERIKQLAQSREQINLTRAKEGKEIISRYLRSKNIDFKTNRLLQMEGTTISVDFLLKGKNIIIKYWNPVEILALEWQPEYRRDYYEKYLESWKGFCREYLQTGGKIHQIISADAQEILAKLPLCTEENGGERTYALAKAEPQP
jgi:hypothetical protein